MSAIWDVRCTFRNFRSSHRRCSVRKGVLKNFAKFTGKYLCQGLSFNKAAGLRPATLLKKRLRHRCFFPWILRKFWEHLFYRTSLVFFYKAPLVAASKKLFLTSFFTWAPAILPNSSWVVQLHKKQLSKNLSIFCGKLADIALVLKYLPNFETIIFYIFKYFKFYNMNIRNAQFSQNIVQFSIFCTLKMFVLLSFFLCLIYYAQTRLFVKKFSKNKYEFRY